MAREMEFLCSSRWMGEILSQDYSGLSQGFELSPTHP